MSLFLILAFFALLVLINAAIHDGKGPDARRAEAQEQAHKAEILNKYEEEHRFHRSLGA